MPKCAFDCLDTPCSLSLVSQRTALMFLSYDGHIELTKQQQQILLYASINSNQIAQLTMTCTIFM